MSRRRALLIDLDGTLVSLSPPRDDLEALRARLVQLASVNRVSVHHRGIFRVYASLYDALGAHNPVVAQARAIIEEHEIAWARTTAHPLLDAGGRAALDRFSGPWALVTNNGMACVVALVERGLVPGTFTSAVTRDAGLRLKPSPEPLARAFETIAGVGDVWFLGDSDADEEAAAAFSQPTGASLRFVRVRDGKTSVILQELTERGAPADR